jgi:3-oxoacyl-(acyl-carrier-protein) synthase
MGARRVAVTGIGMGGAHTLEASYSSTYGRNDFRLRPLSVVMAMNNAAGSNIAVKWGLRGSFAFGGSNVVLIAERP